MSAEKHRRPFVDQPTVPLHRYVATRHVLADRERELLEVKGPCTTTGCRLHYAHVGPCDIVTEGWRRP